MKRYISSLTALIIFLFGGLGIGTAIAAIVNVSWTRNTSTSQEYPNFIGDTVGIGTSSPGSILSIQGVANFVANGTSTMFNGLNVTNGCVSVNGTCLGSGGSGTPGGASSTIQYNANGAFAGNTGLIYDGTNVGIGTTTPTGLFAIGSLDDTAKPALTIADSSNQSKFTILNNGKIGIGTTTPSGVFSITRGSTNEFLNIFSNDGLSDFLLSSNNVAGLGTIIRAQGADILSVENGTTPVLRVTATKVGIGTTTPGTVLSVQDVGNFDTATSTFNSTGGINLTNGCFAIAGSCLRNATLTGSTGQTAYFSGTNTAIGTSTIFINTASNVGIGTTSPQQVLTVQGTTTTNGLQIESPNATSSNILVSDGSANGSAQWQPATNILGQLPNAKYVRGFIHTTLTGDTDIYTVPSNRRALIGNPAVYNSATTTITSFNEVKINGTYYRNSSNVVTTTGAITANYQGGAIVLEAGQSFSVNTSGGIGLNMSFPILEFDNTSSLKSAIALGPSTGTTTLYTVPTKKSAVVLSQFAIFPMGVGNASLEVSNLFFIADAGGTRSVMIYDVPNGGSPDSTSQVSATNSISPSTRGNLATFQATLNAGDSIQFTVNTGDPTQMAWINVIEQ